MTGPSPPGAEGSPVPVGTRVIRFAKQPTLDNLSPEYRRRIGEGKALPDFFRLSSEDEKQPTPRLSVWLEDWTTVQQAWVLVGAVTARRIVLNLDVDRVRSVRAASLPGLPDPPTLDVEWEPARVQAPDGTWVPETRPGYEGHAGVRHLDKGNKTQRKDVAWQLAELAAVRVLTDVELTAFAEPQPG